MACEICVIYLTLGMPRVNFRMISNIIMCYITYINVLSYSKFTKKKRKEKSFLSLLLV